MKHYLIEKMSLQLTDNQAEILSSTFERFNDSGIEYVLLRRWEGLPEYIPGDDVKTLDVDILVAEDDFNNAAEVVKNVQFDQSTSPPGINALILHAAQNPKQAASFISNNTTEALSRVVGVTKQSISTPSESPYDLATQNSYAYQVNRNGVLLDMKNHLSHVSPWNGTRWRLDPTIEQQMLGRREKHGHFYRPAAPDELAHIATHCVFEYDGEFTTYYEERCQALKEQMGDKEWEQLSELLELIYFDASEVVLQNIRQGTYNSIRSELRVYADY
ncbi:hypothetical protein [Natronococcus pandeyae]|uniref:hypothetical protein n=1 Tax=Natronococcus pandeyae TaxID=2055836 RepID=UPI0011E6464D|nr:hypothetical protein [Natronococcus pandeyae]